MKGKGGEALPFEVGQIVNGFTILARLPNTRHGKSRWAVLCPACGEPCSKLGTDLNTSRTASCGCLCGTLPSGVANEGQSRRRLKTGAYRAWQSMRRRVRHDPHYQGRVEIDPAWDNFDAFLEDMGEPEPGQSLDRIDNSQGYNPGNCRWATMTEQARNRSTTVRFLYQGEHLTLAEIADRAGHSRGALRAAYYKLGDLEAALASKRKGELIQYAGKTQTLIEWAAETGIGYGTLYARLNRYGWPLERAFAIPGRMP